MAVGAEVRCGSARGTYQRVRVRRLGFGGWGLEVGVWRLGVGG